MALSPLTSAGISGVNAQNAGAASGVVIHGAALLIHRVTAALSTATAKMGLSVMLVCGLIVWPRMSARRA